MDNSSPYLQNGAASQVGAMFAAFMGVWLIIVLALVVLNIWFFWRIFAKAGFSGALSLLNLIPFGTFVCLIILAFGNWPAQIGSTSGTIRTGYTPPASAP